MVSYFWSLFPGVVNLGAIEKRLDFGVEVSKISLNSSSSNAEGDVFLLKRDIRCLSWDGLNKLGLFDLTDELSVVEGRKKFVLVGLGVVLPGVVLLNFGTGASLALVSVVTLLNWVPIVGVGCVAIVPRELTPSILSRVTSMTLSMKKPLRSVVLTNGLTVSPA